MVAAAACAKSQVRLCHPLPALASPAELTCPYATGNLACVKPGYTVPRDLTARFQAALPAEAVQLNAIGFEGGDRRLLDVLPLTGGLQ